MQHPIDDTKNII